MLALLVVLLAAPRIAFTRSLPPRHDIGSDHAAVIYAIGDNDKVTTFVEVFLTQTNRSGLLQVDDALDRSRHFFGERPSETMIRKINREHPAGVYLGIHRFTCIGQPHEGEGSTYDSTGTRVKQHQVWLDATCHARIDVIEPSTAKRLFSFEAKGEGTSPRVAEMTAEERAIAFEQAARYAAIDASESITARQIRESIELDETAPSFDRGAAMIDAGRFPAVRALWEGELKANPASAALHFDLAAVCEALDDNDCAAEHYREATRIAPADGRYRVAFDQFRKRTLRR